jgi:hypothetical protein
VKRVKHLRNAFAHPKGDTHFHSPHIVKLLAKFSDYDAKMDPYAYFSEKARRISLALENPFQNAALVTALKNHAKPPA